MLLYLLNPIPNDAFQEATKRLDTYCKSMTNRVRASGSEKYRLYWKRRRYALVIAEEFVDERGDLISRDSGKFEYTNGWWLLYYPDVNRRWQRYGLAEAGQSFGAVFRHWVRDETGIFSRVEMEAVVGSRPRGRHALPKGAHNSVYMAEDLHA
ncbi:MAG: DUF3024 domain-containing protein [Pseudomonadota bacterium]